MSNQLVGYLAYKEFAAGVDKELKSCELAALRTIPFNLMPGTKIVDFRSMRWTKSYDQGYNEEKYTLYEGQRRVAILSVDVKKANIYHYYPLICIRPAGVIDAIYVLDKSLYFEQDYLQPEPPGEETTGEETTGEETITSYRKAQDELNNFLNLPGSHALPVVDMTEEPWGVEVNPYGKLLVIQSKADKVYEEFPAKKGGYRTFLVGKPAGYRYVLVKDEKRVG